jgi:predicted transcriptional regulator
MVKAAVAHVLRKVAKMLGVTEEALSKFVSAGFCMLSKLCRVG